MNKLLTQQEADNLLRLEKHYFDKEQYTFPSLGGSLRIPLYSMDRRETFSLDITQNKIKFNKNTFQTRTRTTIILARIDIGGSPHRNPDGEEIQCPHLHIYREGYDDKWAIPLPAEFSNSDNFLTILQEFMDYCNITTKPTILAGLGT